MSLVTSLTTCMGRPLPKGWAVLLRRERDAIFVSSQDLRVIESVMSADVYGDHRRWHHVSVSFPDRLPSWEDLLMVKRLFMGVETTALQVLPPARKHVNIHPFVMHLWRCLDGDVTPDFTRGRNML